MIVLDASAAIEWLLQTLTGQRIERRIYSSQQSLHAPHLLDVEIAHVLRRMVREALITERRAAEAISDLTSVRITRYPHSLFLPWIWRHRNNLSAYDAAYVALAEELGAALLTRDSKLAGSTGHVAKIELF